MATTWNHCRVICAKFDLFYYRWKSAEVDLNGPAPGGNIFDVSGFDGALHLYLTGGWPTYDI